MRHSVSICLSHDIHEYQIYFVQSVKVTFTRDLCSHIIASHHYMYIHILLGCIARSGSYNVSILKCLLRQSFIFYTVHDLIVSYHAYFIP
jgi:hypothetical protein